MIDVKVGQEFKIKVPVQFGQKSKYPRLVKVLSVKEESDGVLAEVSICKGEKGAGRKFRVKFVEEEASADGPHYRPPSPL